MNAVLFYILFFTATANLPMLLMYYLICHFIITLISLSYNAFLVILLALFTILNTYKEKYFEINS